MRLFFALWPASRVRREIQAAKAALFDDRTPGREIRQENLHITLHFIGQVEAADLDCYRQAASQVSMAPFDLVLDHAGHFRRPQVVWLGGHEIPEALTRLVGDLGTALGNCGYQAEDRPFVPHLTILRKIRRFEPRPIEPITWQVKDFVLVHSDTRPEGVRYQVIGRWPAT